MTECEGGFRDPATDLCWQDPPVDSHVKWSENIAYCDSLEAGGHDDWRAPDIDELRSLIRCCPETVTGGACQVTTGSAEEEWIEECRGCEAGFGAGAGPDWCYWDSALSGDCTRAAYCTTSVLADQPEIGWVIQFMIGEIWPLETHIKGSEAQLYVRCVRGPTSGGADQ
jgi:hypothetical protein